METQGSYDPVLRRRKEQPTTDATPHPFGEDTTATSPARPANADELPLKMALASDGAELAWTEEGAGEPMLLIAGQATGRNGWGPTARALATHFRVIRYDHRGIGESSDGSSERYTTRWLASDACTVLEAAGVETAHVYGHSMGGRVAQWMAIDHPHRIGCLILAATSAGGPSAPAGDPAAMEAIFCGNIDQMASIFFDDQWTRDHPLEVRDFFGSQASAWAKARHFAASRNHDAVAELALIRSPTLILHGRDDTLTPLQNGRILHQRIRLSTLVSIPGARHGLHLDHPETVPWIGDFIAASSTPHRR